MIELGSLPAGGAVALPAALTELARMGVVLGVTVNTFLRCTREKIVHMALLAVYFEMRAK